LSGNLAHCGKNKKEAAVHSLGPRKVSLGEYNEPLLGKRGAEDKGREKGNGETK